MYKFTDIENSEIPTGESKMKNSGGCYVKTATGLNSSCNSLPACFCRLLILLKNVLGVPQEFQTNWIQIRPDVFFRSDLDPSSVCNSHRMKPSLY